LWDLDGTLVDSEAFHWQSWRDTLSAEGLAVTYQQFLASFGKKNDPIMREWLGDGYSPERAVRLAETKEADYRRLVATYGLRPLPWAREWLSTLHAAGWKQAIVTSAPAANAAVMLGALEITSLFETVVTAEDVSHGKPDPEVFLTAASRLGIAPAYCIVVEDALAGIEGARRAGMKSVGVSAHVALPSDVFTHSLGQLAPDTFDRLLER
jgi:beta-phosphoglucomutase